MLTENKIQELADLFTLRRKEAFDASRSWDKECAANEAQREWDGDLNDCDELAELSTEKAYAILEEGEREEYGRVEEAALGLLRSVGVSPGECGEELTALCVELMRRCILLSCYEAEKYQGKLTGIYHRSLEEIAARASVSGFPLD